MILKNLLNQAITIWEKKKKNIFKFSICEYKFIEKKNFACIYEHDLKHESPKINSKKEQFVQLKHSDSATKFEINGIQKANNWPRKKSSKKKNELYLFLHKKNNKNVNLHELNIVITKKIGNMQNINEVYKFIYYNKDVLVPINYVVCLYKIYKLIKKNDYKIINSDLYINYSIINEHINIDELNNITGLNEVNDYNELYNNMYMKRKRKNERRGKNEGKGINESRKNERIGNNEGKGINERKDINEEKEINERKGINELNQYEEERIYTCQVKKKNNLDNYYTYSCNNAYCLDYNNDILQYVLERINKNYFIKKLTYRHVSNLLFSLINIKYYNLATYLIYIKHINNMYVHLSSQAISNIIYSYSLIFTFYSIDFTTNYKNYAYKFYSIVDSNVRSQLEKDSINFMFLLLSRRLCFMVVKHFNRYACGQYDINSFYSGNLSNLEHLNEKEKGKEREMENEKEEENGKENKKRNKKENEREKTKQNEKKLNALDDLAKYENKKIFQEFFVFLWSMSKIKINNVYLDLLYYIIHKNRKSFFLQLNEKDICNLIQSMSLYYPIKKLREMCKEYISCNISLTNGKTYFTFHYDDFLKSTLLLSIVHIKKYNYHHYSIIFKCIKNLQNFLIMNNCITHYIEPYGNNGNTVQNENRKHEFSPFNNKYIQEEREGAQFMLDTILTDDITICGAYINDCTEMNKRYLHLESCNDKFYDIFLSEKNPVFKQDNSNGSNSSYSSSSYSSSSYSSSSYSSSSYSNSSYSNSSYSNSSYSNSSYNNNGHNNGSNNKLVILRREEKRKDVLDREKIHSIKNILKKLTTITVKNLLIKLRNEREYDNVNNRNINYCKNNPSLNLQYLSVYLYNLTHMNPFYVNNELKLQLCNLIISFLEKKIKFVLFLDDKTEKYMNIKLAYDEILQRYYDILVCLSNINYSLNKSKIINESIIVYSSVYFHKLYQLFYKFYKQTLNLNYFFNLVQKINERILSIYNWTFSHTNVAFMPLFSLINYNYLYILCKTGSSTGSSTSSNTSSSTSSNTSSSTSSSSNSSNHSGNGYSFLLLKKMLLPITLYNNMTMNQLRLILKLLTSYYMSSVFRANVDHSPYTLEYNHDDILTCMYSMCLIITNIYYNTTKNKTCYLDKEDKLGKAKYDHVHFYISVAIKLLKSYFYQLYCIKSSNIKKYILTNLKNDEVIMKFYTFYLFVKINMDNNFLYNRNFIKQYINDKEFSKKEFYFLEKLLSSFSEQEKEMQLKGGTTKGVAKGIHLKDNKNGMHKDIIKSTDERICENIKQAVSTTPSECCNVEITDENNKYMYRSYINTIYNKNYSPNENLDIFYLLQKNIHPNEIRMNKENLKFLRKNNHASPDLFNECVNKEVKKVEEHVFSTFKQINSSKSHIKLYEYIKYILRMKKNGQKENFNIKNEYIININNIQFIVDIYDEYTNTIFEIDGVSHYTKQYVSIKSSDSLNFFYNYKSYYIFKHLILSKYYNIVHLPLHDSKLCKNIIYNYYNNGDAKF
ncbi:conserved Plasmodium protein, unknown function [Plasmodium malariae]|uniref:RAP protein n=1 Tax=Plasmodium malariae TaxID=5858 RepID=A0A1D3RHV0_PLAMA|nr:conserved Plasmodium protein, unknown function [Plasmodium malariae]SCN44715.1 conserved Plasmodium protein, unknown function [Plasmodium malariae]